MRWPWGEATRSCATLRTCVHRSFLIFVLAHCAHPPGRVCSRVNRPASLRCLNLAERRVDAHAAADFPGGGPHDLGVVTELVVPGADVAPRCSKLNRRSSVTPLSFLIRVARRPCPCAVGRRHRALSRWAAGRPPDACIARFTLHARPNGAGRHADNAPRHDQRVDPAVPKAAGNECACSYWHRMSPSGKTKEEWL